MEAKRAGDYWELNLQDRHDSNESVTIKCRVVLNTSGPWGDQLTGRLTGNSKRRMVGLKGIHILVNLPEELAEWGMMGINSENETIVPSLSCDASCLQHETVRHVVPLIFPSTQVHSVSRNPQ